MLLTGSPLTLSLLRESGSHGRFWYWQGASGRRYIHTVYPVRACPPLPGAIFVAVKRIGTLRTVLSLGLLNGFEDFRGADEIHVHLLSGSKAEAEAILADLGAGLAAMEAPTPMGFAEAA
jgi:hypothetical protein